MEEYKIRKSAILVIALDILAAIMNLIFLMLEFNMLRLNLILALIVLAEYTYELEKLYIHTRWQNKVIEFFLEEEQGGENE